MRQVHVLMVTCFLFFIAYVRRRLSTRKKDPENITEAAGSNKDNQGEQIKEKILLIADKKKSTNGLLSFSSAGSLDNP